MKKINIWLILIIVLLSVYIVMEQVNYIKEKSKQDGFIEGVDQGQLSIVKEISNTGRIPIFVNQSTVEWFPVQQFCQEG